MLHFQFDENFDQPIKINSQPTAPNVYKWEIVRKHLSLPLSHSRHSNRKLKNINNSTKTQMRHAVLKISYKTFAQTNIVSWCSRNSRILLHINYCFVLVLRGWWLTIVQLKSTPEVIISFRAKFFSLSMALMRDCVRRANFTTKPRLKAKFFAFALFMRGYSFQLHCPGNSFMQNFATLYFENETWWWNLLVWRKHA